MPQDGKAAPVWARKTVAIESCPKSYITAESEGLVEAVSYTHLTLPTIYSV